MKEKLKDRKYIGKPISNPVFVSLCANSLRRKKDESIYSPSRYGYIVGKTEFFSLGNQPRRRKIQNSNQLCPA